MVLPGVGHIAFEEMPDVCNQAMRDWLINPFAVRAAPQANRHPTFRSAKRQPKLAAQPDLAQPNSLCTHDRISSCIRSSFGPGESVVP